MIVVYCDGLCEPRNPGGVATYGFVLYKNSVKIHEGYGVEGEGTGMSNNLAEYAALCKALEYLRTNNLVDEEIVVRADSRLLIRQMAGEWKVHRGLYLSKHNEARCIQASFSNIRFEWIPRERNIEADALSRKAYENYLGTEH